MSEYKSDARMYRLAAEDLMENPGSRLPLVICVECSYSMRPWLEQVSRELEQFRASIEADPESRSAVELCLISCGGTRARVEQGFSLVGNCRIPAFVGEGGVPLADGAVLALKMLESRRSNFSSGGVGNRAPVILFVGGAGHTGSLGETGRQFQKEVKDQNITVLCLGVGDREKVRRSALRELAPDGKVYFMDEMKLGNFLKNVSQAIQHSYESILRGMEVFAQVESWEDVMHADGTDAN